MSAFKNLRDVSVNFEADLRRLTTELFSAKVGESFEDSIVKKLRDLSLFKSKLKLLRAKPAPPNPSEAEHRDQQTILEEYEDTATSKVLEQQIVKFLTQSHAVKALITTPSSSLEPELVERKEKIIEALTNFRHQESQLRHLQTVLNEKQQRLDEVRRRWDIELGQLRDARDGADEAMEVEAGPLHRKLSTLVDKMEVMRWLVSKLATSRSSSYDWLSDPHQRLKALLMARHACSVEEFIGDS